MEAVAVLIPSGFFIMVAFVVFTVARSRAAQAQMQAEVQAKLIERFTSAPELVEFLQSKPGKEFMGGVDTLPKLHASDRILSGIRKGIITAILGVGFLLLCLSRDVYNEGFLITGGILTAIGVGYFVSTFVSIRLSRAWGLMPGSIQEPSRETSSINS